MFSWKLCFLQIFVIELAFCDWVEIPLSAKKSHLVTPYNPYVYTPSLVFTSTTTEHYNTLQPLQKPKIIKSDPKKSITKMPDAVLRKTTTDYPHYEPSTLKPVITHAFVNKVNVSFSNNHPNHPKRPNLHHPYIQEPFVTSTPASVSLEVPKLSNKNFQVTNDDDEFEEDDEYEQVYDDDEDHYDENDDDLSGEGGDDGGDGVANDDGAEDVDDDNMDDPFDGPADDDEYYDDNEYDEDPPVNEAKGNTDYQTNANTDSNGFSYANFLPYLKNIQSTLIRTSHTDTVNNKVSFLTDIKNRLLYAIQGRINTIWEPRSKRKARSTRGDMWDSWEKGDKGMEFPSNEGALLTLGFLTFAVFLIKCILKLIHSIKGKEHDKGSTQIIIQNGTSITAINGLFNGRSLPPEGDMNDIEIAKFMANLEGYTSH